MLVSLQLRRHTPADQVLNDWRWRGRGCARVNCGAAEAVRGSRDGGGVVRTCMLPRYQLTGDVRRRGESIAEFGAHALSLFPFRCPLAVR